MRYRRALAVIAGGLLIAGPERAAAAAVYYATATVEVEFVGLDHAGGRVGVSVFPDAFSGLGDDGFGTGDGVPGYSSSANLTDDWRGISSSADGWVSDGSVWSGAGIEGGFWVDNTESPYEATAYFRVSGRLDLEIDVTADTVGYASAFASIWGDSVSVSSTGGQHAQSEVFSPFVYSMTVVPGYADLFSVPLWTEGRADARPRPAPKVPEPSCFVWLAAGSAATTSLRRRRS